eukprot:CAMPEP_0201599476 /NCGR_PEP_ID=MMETSP0492-20130828/911_1 /ASSEMBLY_ACC=CAM_ASM_000837 /TAXON_ID=420259 /ORGANISM="Thalassiosira gravida, Strain GMp14c1" /LENGTH=100 /DNA_ID=CAMNT_0048062059 /DNA_START=434 /DNA_END=736 /DNA_ORIENTATION=+
MGNARAEQLYGSSKAMASLPSSNASHNQWLEFFRDKYERRQWAKVTETTEKNCTKRTKSAPPQLPEQQGVATGDLLGLQQGQKKQQPGNQCQDFFAQFDL